MPLPGDQTIDLTGVLSAQTMLYDRAIRIAEGLDSAATSDGRLANLQAILDEIANCGSLLGDVQSLSESNRPEVRAGVDALRERIETLLALINGAEERFRLAGSKLLPKVRREVAARRMLDAYGGQK